MGKILVLGNNAQNVWQNDLPNAHFVQMPMFSLGENGEGKLSEFVTSTVTEDIEVCVLDVENIKNSELCLAFAMTLRLSIFELKKQSLIPILFISNTTQDIYHGYKYSSIILTGAVAFEVPECVNDAIEVMESLTPEEYKTKFLDIVKILPNATEGRHSLANQWGADVLHRIVLGTSTNNALIEKARRSLYFKYTRALTLNINDLRNIVECSYVSESGERIEPIVANGKKILLIDDEADKGWSDVLSALLKGADFNTICEQAPDYESLSENARNKIEKGNYDLIFLDLRMNGVSEENVLTPENLSGMKILKAIKGINKGTQVIMFTASNKAWNMKALLDNGADGYYIKESPEYAFPNSYSKSNANELVDIIKGCLSNGYLRSVYNKIRKLKEFIKANNYYGERNEEILGSIDIAYDLLSKSENKQEYKSYAYLQLFLAIEEYVKLPSLFCETGNDLYLYNDNNVRFRILKDKKNKGKLFSYNSVLTMKNGTGHFVLENGIFESRFLETNFLVSALLIFKFNEINSAAYQWTKIYKVRNDAAHPKEAIIAEEDFHRILAFMLHFFDHTKANWRDPSQAFPDISEKEQLAMLKNKFNRR